MASSDTVTYDQTPPIRPGIDDLGGGQKVNRTQPPDPVTMMSASDFNQTTKQVVELAAVVPIVIVAIHFVAGAPQVYSVTGMGAWAKDPSHFTLQDNGTGDTTVSWAASKFPNRTAEADASITGATVGMISTETLTNSARVRTLGSGGAAADLPFILRIYGQ